MEEQTTVPRNEIADSLSKAELIKFQSFEDKILHYDTRNPFLAILGTDTDRLIEVFTQHVQRIFEGGTKIISYTEAFDLSGLANKDFQGLFIIQLTQAANSSKEKIAENLLFYRDIVKERNMKLIVLCTTEVFNELQLRATDFTSMALDANQFTDLREVAKNDLKESDTLSEAKTELEEKIKDWNRYKKFGILNQQVFFERLKEIAFTAVEISQFEIALKLYYEMLDYAVRLGTPYNEMVAYAGLGDLLGRTGKTSQAILYLKTAMRKSEILGEKEVLMELENNLASIYSASGQFQLAEHSYKAALTSAKKYLNKSVEAAILGNLGHLSYRQGKSDRAISLYNQSLSIRRQIADREKNMSSYGVIYTNLALIYRDKGDRKQALKYNHEALNIDRATNNRAGVALDLNNIGDILLDSGEYLVAIKYYNEALKINKEINNLKGEMETYQGLAVANTYLGKLGDSEEYLAKSRNLETEIISPIHRIHNYTNLGNLALAKEDWETALKYFQDCYNLSSQINYPEGIIEGLTNIGAVYVNRDEFDTALINFTQALELSEKIKSLREQPVLMCNIATIWLEQGKYEESLSLMKKALSLARETQSMDQQFRVLLSIFELFKQNGKIETGLRYLTEAKEIASTMDNKEILFKEISEAEKRAA